MEDTNKLMIKKMHSKAVIPQYQTVGAVGMDFHAVVDLENCTNLFDKERKSLLLDHIDYIRLEKSIIKDTLASTGQDVEKWEPVAVVDPMSKCIVDTGLAFAVPDGFEMQIRPRSGLAFKNSITIINAPGTLDPDFRGSLKIILFNLSNVPFIIFNGDRVAQGVINRVCKPSLIEVNELPETERGENGFGSTGV